MVFVAKKANKHFGAFGPPKRSISKIREDLARAFSKARYASNMRKTGGKGSLSLKQLRNCFADALSLNIIFQPVVVACSQNTKSGLKDNPVWDHAPRGAFYKAKRLSSLLTLLALHGDRANIEHDLVRLSTQVWNLHRRCFDGLLRRIRARVICADTRSVSNPKRPEATERLNANSKSVYFGRVKWCTKHHKYRLLKPGMISMRSSNSVGLVQRVLKVLARAQMGVAHSSSYQSV